MSKTTRSVVPPLLVEVDRLDLHAEALKPDIGPQRLVAQLWV